MATNDARDDRENPHLPNHGPRPLSDSSSAAEVRLMPDPKKADDAVWADYVFNRCGEPSIQREWWYHSASSTWFIAERDTISDEIVRTYLWGGEDTA